MDASIAELYANLQRDKLRRQAKHIGLVLREPVTSNNVVRKPAPIQREYKQRPQNPGLRNKRNVRLQKIATKYKDATEHPAEQVFIKRFMKKIPSIVSSINKDHYGLQGMHIFMTIFQTFHLLPVLYNSYLFEGVSLD